MTRTLENLRTVLPKRSISGRTLAGIGVFVVLLDVGLRVFSWVTGKPYTLDHTVMIVGAILGFIGFWIIDPKRTKEGAQVITDALPKFGRRATDAVAVPSVETHVTPVLPTVIVEKAPPQEDGPKGGTVG